MPIGSGRVGGFGVKATPGIKGPHRGIALHSPALSWVKPGIDAGATFVLDATATTSLPSQITISRTSSATYFDSSGVLQTATSGVARFDNKPVGASWTPAGLLVEQQNTNFIFQAFVPSNARWAAGSATVTTGITDLQGGTSAVMITNTASTAGHGIFVDGANLTAGNVYTLRVYVAQGTAPYVWFQDWNNSTDFFNGSIRWSDLSLETNCSSVGASMAGPYYVGTFGGRAVFAVDMTYTHQGTSAAQVGVGPATKGVGALTPVQNFTDTSVGTETCYVYGSLYYDGPSRPTITPILTTTAAVTRSADIFTSTDATLLAAQGWVVEVGELPTATASTLLGINTAIGLGETTGNALTTADGGTQTTGNTASWASQHRAGIAWDATPRVSIDLDGSTVVTAANTPVTPANLYFGNTNNGAGGFLNGHLRLVASYAALTNSQLATISVPGAPVTTAPAGLSPVFSVDWTATSTLPSQVTLSRTSAATYFNSSGVLASASSGVARIEYNPATLVQQGLLLEEQRTNLQGKNTNLSDASFSIFGVTRTTDGTLDPNGGSMAKLTTTATTEAHGQNSSVTFSGLDATVVSVSIVAKAGSTPFVYLDWSGTNGNNNFVTVVFNLSGTSDIVQTQTLTGGSTGTLVKAYGKYLGGGYFRLTLVSSSTDSGGLNSHFVEWGIAGAATGQTQSGWGEVSFAGSGAQSVYFGLPQVEAGADSSSIILTPTSSAVTRSADILGSTDATLLAAQAWVIETGELEAATASTLLGINTAIGLGETTGNALTTADGGTQTSGNTGTWTSQNRGGIAWDSTPRVSIDLDGGTVVTAANTPITPTALYFGNTNNGASGFLNGHLRMMAAYAAVSDTQLATISAVGASFTIGGGTTSNAAGTAAGTSTVAAVGASLAAATGAAAGTSTVTATGKALFNGVGSAAGTSTVTATGVALANSVGNAAGTSTVLATGQSTAALVGASAGSSTVSGVGAALAASVGSAAGTSTDAATGASIAKGVGNAAGVSTALGISGTVGAAAGISTVTGVGAALFKSVGAAAGTSTVTATGQAALLAVGTATGTSIVAATGRALAASVGNAAGAGTATGVGSAAGIFAAVGTAAGSSTVSGVGAASIFIQAIPPDPRPSHGLRRIYPAAGVPGIYNTDIFGGGTPATTPDFSSGDFSGDFARIGTAATAGSGANIYGAAGALNKPLRRTTGPQMRRTYKYPVQLIPGGIYDKDIYGQNIYQSDS